MSSDLQYRVHSNLISWTTGYSDQQFFKTESNLVTQVYSDQLGITTRIVASQCDD